MLAVGLTGNIACGKSFVASVFAEMGAMVLDADLVAHDLLLPEEDTRRLVVEAFGPGIVNEDGSINRRRLGAIVFSDVARRGLLNSIVHPEVRRRISKWLGDARLRMPRGLAVVQAALMVESGSYTLYDRIVIATCPPAVQLERLMRTRGLSEIEARLRIEAQPPQSEKAALANVVIENNGTFDQLRRQVQRHWQDIASRRHI